ncbi:hypothetical protein CI109_100486 [Kwoniella shandongensis]|uniref:ubiquitinyl hydrolase 1 n=1 Tax=Kwoniella shandongensis TaxID=1734106 RepID=A0AAJ8MUZ3_9TREE
MDDFVSFPEMLDLAPFLAPNRQDYKVTKTANGPKATYMDWPNPDQGPELEPVMYRLYAVVVHMGTMIGGHYIAYCLVDPEQMFGPNHNLSEQAPTTATESASISSEPSQNGTSTESGSASQNGQKKDRRIWCFCSDTSIRTATLDEVLNARAYLCFYEKVTSS